MPKKSRENTYIEGGTMIHTGKLLHMELYDDMMPPYTDVRAV